MRHFLSATLIGLWLAIDCESGQPTYMTGEWR